MANNSKGALTRVLWLYYVGVPLIGAPLMGVRLVAAPLMDVLPIGVASHGGVSHCSASRVVPLICVHSMGAPLIGVPLMACISWHASHGPGAYRHVSVAWLA
jgi:hypothetical protein